MRKILLAAIVAAVCGGSAWADPIIGVVQDIHRGNQCYAFTIDGVNWQAIDLSEPGAFLQGMGVEGSYNSRNTVPTAITYVVQQNKIVECNPDIFPGGVLPVATMIDSFSP